MPTFDELGFQEGDRVRLVDPPCPVGVYSDGEYTLEATGWGLSCVDSAMGRRNGNCVQWELVSGPSKEGKLKGIAKFLASKGL